MRFLWPSALVVLAMIPALILLYVWRQRRRRKFAVRYSSLSLVRAALPAQSRLRRYLPMALFFLALASLVLGLSRPVTVTRVPAGRATIMLTLDVSGSMRQGDIFPSRLEAAEDAATRFIEAQKDTNQVGLVAFAGIAQLVQAPTTDAPALKTAIRNLTTGRGTAIGDGIVTALQSISDFNQSAGATSTPVPGASTEEDYKPDIIVLLTDGVATTGVDPIEAAEQAKDNKIRIYTIGFGTAAGANGRGFGRGGGFGGGSGGRGGFRWGIDEQGLQTIASMTGGKYYTASSAGELQQVFDSLPRVLISREQTTEIGVIFAALAALLVTGAIMLTQLWHPLA